MCIVKKKRLFRMIVPDLKANVFSGIMKYTIALGPLIVATCAKGENWDVEVIHEAAIENEISRDKNGNISHQALQAERPADVIGLYCGITSTMERAWEIAKLYKSLGVKLIIAGGAHVQYEPLESLRRGIDLVCYGEGEPIIKRVLESFEKGGSFSDIPNLIFLEKNGEMIKAPSIALPNGHDPDLNELPDPDFDLIKHRRVKVFPIGRIRGCGMACEFCSVKAKGRWACPEKLFETVHLLVRRYNAREFFLVDDRVEEDREGTLEFFKLIQSGFGNRLDFTVQIRLGAAEDKELLYAMREAGVELACIGFESPISEDLKAMKKGLSAKKMLEWVSVFRKMGFRIHAMFIFGYPSPTIKSSLSVAERIRAYKGFIKKSKVSTIQVLKPIPLPGTELRARLAKSGQLLPLEAVPWGKYDGNHACFIPDDMDIRDLQESATEIMKWFYHGGNYIYVGLWFMASLVFMPFGQREICRKTLWTRIIRAGGHRIVVRWRRNNDEEGFIKKLESYPVMTR